MSARRWCVYQWENGTLWTVTPADRETALREAEMVGLGHEAMTETRAKDLRNSFAHGRLYGYNQAMQEPHHSVTPEEDPS